MKSVAWCLVVAAFLLSGCGADDPVEIVRPPLASPPDPGPAPESDGLSDALRDELAQSTVRINSIACGRSAEGSGFAVADDLIATNAHVVLGVMEPTIEFLDGSSTDGTVVAFDAVNDLALIRLDTSDLVPLELGTAPDGTIGAVFGWETGPTVEPTPFRVDRPVSVRIETVGTDERILRPSWLLAADIESGDSGAALIDSDGVVVGIAYATTTRGSSVGYAVRADALADLLELAFDTNLVVPPCGPA